MTEWIQKSCPSCQKRKNPDGVAPAGIFFVVVLPVKNQAFTTRSLRRIKRVNNAALVTIST